MSTADINHELECKLDAKSDNDLINLREFVMSSPVHFTPAIERVRVGIPPAMLNDFDTPLEITEPRIRLYFDDQNLSAYSQGIEIRQEPRPSGGIKQMVKIGGNANTDNPILDRMEYSANLARFGVTLSAIPHDPTRKRVKSAIKPKDLKPIICMISQRTRIKYHPAGDPLTTIELGFDVPCRGHALGGFTWSSPQLELELITGPTSALKAESDFLARTFNLTPNLTSKPFQGFEYLKQYLQTSEGKAAFKVHPENSIWWT